MKLGKAFAIFKNIDLYEFPMKQKAEAIKVVMNAATLNSITKADMLRVIRWLWKLVFDETAGDGEWIPVSERLPDADGRYLCCVKSSAFRGATYQDILRYDKDGFRDGCIYTDDVTHWMNLPLDPPKEASE